MKQLNKFLNLMIALYNQPLKLVGIIYNSIKEDYNKLNELDNFSKDYWED